MAYKGNKEISARHIGARAIAAVYVKIRGYIKHITWSNTSWSKIKHNTIKNKSYGTEFERTTILGIISFVLVTF